MSPAEVISAAGSHGILVGGQAIEAWAEIYSIPIPREALTTDIDYYGFSSDAKQLHAKVGGKVWIATLDDVTTQSAKLVLDNGLVVDFIAVVFGVNERVLKKRAFEAVEGGTRLMHPLDVLRSRIANLKLPGRADIHGLTQAKLAAKIARRFLDDEIQRDRRAGLNAIEEVIHLAQDKIAEDAYDKFGYDLMTIIPIKRFEKSDPFRAKRWPRVVEHVESLRVRAAES